MNGGQAVAAKPGSTITKSIPLGNTGVTPTTFYVTAVDVVYNQGAFVSATVSIAGYLDASHTDSLVNDSIKPVSGPAANQDIMAWATAAVVADAKYSGGIVT
jgi:hypothetical protein